MNIFHLLDLQNKIEETRLILGKKLDKHLSGGYKNFLNFLHKILFHNKFGLYSCFLVFLLSIFIRSTRDIGYDSAMYLDLIQNSDGVYYRLFFCINSIPVLLAKLFNISPIILVDIFYNIIGLLAISFCTKVLKERRVFKEVIELNLMMISLFIGYFLRPYTLEFNEFSTQSSLLLAFVFIYIGYFLVDDKSLTKSDHLISGFVAALLCLLKLNYGLIVIFCEIYRVFASKNLKTLFSLRNYVTLAILLIFFVFFPAFFKLPIVEDINVVLAIFSIFKMDVAAILFLYFICFSFIRQNANLKKLFFVFFTIALAVFLEFSLKLDQKSIIHIAYLPALLLLIYQIINNKNINFNRDWIGILMLLIVPQFGIKSSIPIMLNLVVFWWVFVLFNYNSHIGYLQNINQKRESVLIPTNVSSWFYFILLVVGSWLWFLTSIDLYGVDSSNIAWIFCAILLILFINSEQKIYEEAGNKGFFRTKTLAIFAIISCCLSYYIDGIFHLQSYSSYKSPNYLSDQISYHISSLGDNEKYLIISPKTKDHYPLKNYLEKGADIANNHDLFKNKNNKLIFIHHYNDQNNSACEISFLESSLRDFELRSDFVKNYRFLNRIIHFRESVMSKNLDKNQVLEQEELKYNNIIIHDVEVYISKN